MLRRPALCNHCGRVDFCVTSYIPARHIRRLTAVVLFSVNSRSYAASLLPSLPATVTTSRYRIQTLLQSNFVSLVQNHFSFSFLLQFKSTFVCYVSYPDRFSRFSIAAVATFEVPDGRMLTMWTSTWQYLQGRTRGSPRHSISHLHKLESPQAKPQRRRPYENTQIKAHGWPLEAVASANLLVTKE